MSDPLYRLSIVALKSDLDSMESWCAEQLQAYPVRQEKPRDAHGVLECYLEGAAAAHLSAAAFRSAWPDAPVKVEVVPAQDWEESWKKHFHPAQIGKRIWVQAPWHQPPEDLEDPAIVTINPGLSFGTGNHFTTRFCLEWVERLVERGPGDALLDLGTGSAILSIAAAKLGAGPAWGIDHDTLALDAARENVKANGVEDQVTLELRDLSESFPTGTWPMVFANIYDPLLIEWAPRIWNRVGHTLVLSGIRTEFVDAVAAAYAAQGAEEVARDSDPEWAGLVMERSPSTND